MLDIDHFKTINDEFGHKIGDEVLQMLAGNIADNLRTIDCFARWGGEEFMIILPELNLQQAYEVAEKLRQLVATVTFPHQQPLSCSFGVAQYHSTETLDQLLQRLDKLLYSAKSGGRNCVKRELTTA